MTQSLELLPGAEGEVLLREHWRRLADAGLPSLAQHRGETNRPHVTIGVTQQVPPEVEPRFADLLDRLPLTVQLGGPVLFAGPRQTRVLAWLVVPTRALLEVHAAAAELMGHLPGTPRHLEVGAWTPHLTLAHRLPVSQIAEAVHALGELPPTVLTLVSLRRWDSDARRAWSVADPAQVSGRRPE